MTERLEIVISGDARKLLAELKRAGLEVGNFSQRTEQSGSGVKRLAGSVAGLTGSLIGPASLAGGLTLAAGAMRTSINLAKEQARVEAQLAAVLQSTGGAAGLSAAELKTMASGLQDITNYGDEAIIAGESLLLTFTNIGESTFPLATKTMLDMSAALDQGMKQSAIQLGKALNDPIRGVSALREVGVSFTAEQEKVIKSLAESGELAQAQALILEELQTEFGGSAEAAREADAGVQAAKNALGDLAEVIGARALPMVNTLSEAVIRGAKGWQTYLNATGAIRDVNSQVAANLGYESLQQMNTALKFGVLSQEDYEAALADVNREMQAQEAATMRAAGAAAYYQAQIDEAAAAEEAATQRRRGAEAARYGGLAGGYRTNETLVSQKRALEAQREASVAAMESAGEKAAESFGQSFSSAMDNLSGMIGSELQSTLGEVWQPKEDERRVDEWARRLADVAAGNTAWVEELAGQFGGEDFFQPFIEAMESGDQGKLQEAANGLLNDAVARANLIDKELVKARVRQQLVEQQVREELIAEIRNELAAEGAVSKATSAAVREDDNWPGVGEVIVEGVDKGIDENYNQVVERIKEMAKAALTAAEQELGIQSPSRVFMEIGDQIGAGLVAGLDSSAPGVQQAVASMLGTTAGYGQFSDVLGAAADDLEKFLDDRMSQAKGGLVRRAFKDSLRANWDSVVDPATGLMTEAAIQIMQGAVGNWEAAGIQGGAVDSAAKAFVEMYNRTFATKLTERVESGLTQAGALSTFGSFFGSSIEGNLALQKALGLSRADQMALESTIDMFGETQQQLQFIQNQQELNELIGELGARGINAERALRGLSFTPEGLPQDIALLQQQLALMDTLQAGGVSTGGFTPGLGGETVGLISPLAGLIEGIMAQLGRDMQALARVNGGSTFNLNVNSNLPTNNLVQDYYLMRSTAGA